MSLPLVDQRVKVTNEVAALLEALHVSTGMEKSEIARDVLHRWALVEIRKTMVLYRELSVKGIARDYEVTPGLYRSTVGGEG